MKRTALFYLCASAICVALIAVCSFISIPIGHQKFTLQLLAVLFAAGLLPIPYAIGTISAYILLGMIGVPVFAGFTSGLAAVAGATGGYIVGFLPTVVCASVLLHFLRKPTLIKTIGIFSVSTLLCYVCGVIGFCIYMPEKGLIYALTVTLLPYLWFDAIKIVVAAILTDRLRGTVLKLAKGEG